MQKIIVVSIVHSLLFHTLTKVNAEPIVGSKVKNIQHGDYSFIVSIGKRSDHSNAVNSHFCAGSLITKKHVLTAEHCLEDVTINEIQILYGSRDLASNRMQKLYPKSWLTYEQWASKVDEFIEFPGDNDIALITLSSVIDDPDFKPATLSIKESEDLYNSKVMMAGWGDTSSGSTPSIMQEVSLRVITNSDCERKFMEFSNLITIIHKRMMCTVAQPSTLGSEGDSGNPVLEDDHTIAAIYVGVCPETDASCQSAVNYNVGVHYYREFIEDVMYNF